MMDEERAPDSLIEASMPSVAKKVHRISEMDLYRCELIDLDSVLNLQSDQKGPVKETKKKLIDYTRNGNKFVMSKVIGNQIFSRQ